MSIVIQIAINAVAVWVATLIVPGVSINEGSTQDQVLTYVLVGALFGLVNTLIKPVVKFFTFPFYILTLGLIAFIVNAFMLVITEWLSHALGLSFEIDDFFWSAIGAAIVIWFVSMVLNVVLPDGD